MIVAVVAVLCVVVVTSVWYRLGRDADRRAWNQATHEIDWLTTGLDASTVIRAAPCGSQDDGVVSGTWRQRPTTDVPARLRADGWRSSVIGKDEVWRKEIGGRSVMLSVTGGDLHLSVAPARCWF